ncbi:MAG: hypothetical protein ACRC8Q_04420 [Aeromonas sp.]
MAIPLSGVVQTVLGANGDLSSLWDGLNPHLLARIFEVDLKGNAIAGGPVVRAPFGDDVQLDVEMNWQSPFENAGAEGAAPALSSALQSGALASEVDRVGKAVGVDAAGASGALREGQGRAGMTKLNSTQIFSGAPPLRIQGELIFRAWRNPVAEVEAPMDQLVSWALPKFLAPEGSMIGAAAEFATSENKSAKTLVQGAFPSLVPSMVALIYKGRRYGPMVIERIGVPLGSPIDKLGRFTQIRLPITLCSLTAQDRNDWAHMKRMQL